MSTQPLRQVYAHRVDAWAPGIPLPAGTVRRAFPDLRLALVAGERLRAGLACEADTLQPAVAGFERELDAFRPQLLLVEASQEEVLAPWGLAAFNAGTAETPVAGLLDWARRRGVPAVLWNTQDRSWGEHFRAAAARFDAVFCADPREAETLRGTGVDAEPLAPAAQPRIHNPFRDFDQYNALDIGVLYDSLIDLFTGTADRTLLARFLRHGLRCIDSRSQVFSSKIGELGEFAPAVLGCADPEAALTALKYARAALFAESTVRTRTSQHWSMVEAAACRVPVLHLGRLDEDDPRRGFAQAFDGADALEAELDRFAADDLYRRKRAQPVWRAACLGHTFAHRLSAICARLGLDARWNEFPGATMVTPTRWPESLPRCIETFRRQRWPAKDLVLVVNRDSLAECGDIVGGIRASGDMQIVNVPEELYAGACLNTGHVLARGEYCFRVDDDDYYGEHYLMDMMLHLRCLDADVCGKPPRFVYFEAEDQAWERSFRVPELTVLPPEHVARNTLWLGGNTLGGRREALLRARYPDDVYGSADTVFQMSAGQQGLRIVSLDELNMIASRRSGEGTHTWTASAEELQRDARLLGPGTGHAMA